MDSDTPGQSGPAEIQTSPPLVAPPVELPPPASAGRPVAPASEPDEPERQEQPEPVRGPELPDEPERPEQPEPQLAQRVHRQGEGLSALLATVDEQGAAIVQLQQQHRTLARNDLILAAGLALCLLQLGKLASKYLSLSIEDAIEGGGDAAGEVLT